MPRGQSANQGRAHPRSPERRGPGAHGKDVPDPGRSGRGPGLCQPGRGGKDYSLLVTGVTENYVSHYIYLTKTGYERLLGKTFAANQALCSFTETDQDFENELAETLMGLDEVTSASFNSGLADYFDDMMASLDSVVLIIILSAGTLAFVVLYNLANINVHRAGTRGLPPSWCLAFTTTR